MSISDNRDAKIVMEQYLHTLFPDNETYDQVLRMCSKLYYNLETAHKLYIFCGIGGTGKTMFLNLLRKMFDERCFNIPIEWYSSKPQKIVDYLMLSQAQNIGIIEEINPDEFYDYNIFSKLHTPEGTHEHDPCDVIMCSNVDITQNLSESNRRLCEVIQFKNTIDFSSLPRDFLPIHVKINVLKAIMEEYTYT
jgi:DNA polymerase III delta prime subunit